MTLIGHIADNNGNPLVGYIGGIKGNTGRGIASIVENADYTITINLTDGTSYTTEPIAGFTDVAFDENYDLVVTKTDGTTITVETDLGSYEDLLKGYKDDAETAATNAGNSETAASGYASNALSSENNASTYANNASGSATAASGSADSASASASSASTQALKSEGFALGEQNGSAVASGSPYYHNNSKYFSQLSSASSTNASTSATNANTDALKAEGYAVGKQNGTDVGSGSDYYQNNSKFYSGQASSSATLASASSLVAEGWAKGEQNGTPVSSGTYFEDNAKYYAEQAETFADSAEDSKDAVIGGIDSLLPTVSLPKADILSFTDGQAVIPAKSLVADIDPIQDLHGYDAPWVRGVGKNKLKYPYDGASGSSNGITWVINDDGTITIGGTATANVIIQISNANTPYTIGSGTQSVVSSAEAPYNPNINGINFQTDMYKDGAYVGTVQKNAVSRTITDATTIGIGQSRISIANGTVVPTGTIFYPQIEFGGTTPTSWTPYENICPISGWDAVGVTRAGKNLVDKTNFTQTNAFVWGYRNVGYKLKGGVTYTFSTSFTFDSMRFVSVDEQTVYAQVTASNKITYTPASDTNVVFRLWHGSAFDFTDITVQLELGTTATTYEPYNGTTYTTTLPSTTYGGTLDVVSGVLTVDRVLFTLQGQFTGQSLSEGTNTVRGFYSNSLFTDEIKPNNTTTNTLYCDKFETYEPDYIASNDVMGISENKNQTTNGLWFRINKSLLSAYTWAGITEWFSNNPTQVCYLLKTPLTYQLTPRQVELLLGENNIFATSGEVAIIYNADVQRYIDNAVGTKEEDMVANNAISSGSLFSVNDRLYKATATIAVGETIVVGVNCTETSIIEQLNALITLL